MARMRFEMLLVGSLLLVPAVGSARGNAQAPAQLAKARVAAAAKVFAATEARLKSGVGSTDAVYTWSVRWLDAERDDGLRGVALAHALHDHTTRMKALSVLVHQQVNRGAATASDGLATDYYVVEAQLWEARATPPRRE